MSSCTRKKLCNNDKCEICFNKSFASSNKAKYWSSKNEKKSREVFKSSGSKYFFNCDKCSHGFDSSLASISSNRGNWCPYCANQKLCDNDTCKMCFNNSFASSNEAEYWSSKNKKKSREIFKSSGNKYFFNCNKCFHNFNTSLHSITNTGSWCPYCSNKKLCDDDTCNICFNKSFASSDKAKYWSSKNEKKSREVSLNSNKKYFFNCDKCSHEFDSKLGDITNGGNWCPYCSNKKLCDNTCEMCLNKSFASSNKAKYLSDKNKKIPRKIFKSSNEKYFFNCDKCSHEFDSALYSISSGNWCPYCSNQKLCDNNICKMCFNNSFASSNKAKYWSSKNEKKSREVFKSSHKKYFFDCDKCLHEFYSKLGNISNLGRWCPYCSNQKLCDNDTCKMCFNNSFASSNKAKYWSDKNEEKPREVFKNSHNKYFFNCDKCFHEFYSALYNITNGHWCPNCVNKTEKIFLDFLKEHFNNFEIEKEKKFEWCKNKSYLPFDFYIEELSIIIELDGEQHFSQVSYWKSPEERQIIDKFKMDKALSNGITVVRILQEDVYHDRNDWKNKIIFALNQKYLEPECVFIFNDKFDIYIDYNKKQSKIISSENDIIKVPILQNIKIIEDNLEKISLND